MGCTDMCVCAEVPPIANMIQQFDLRKENGKVTIIRIDSRGKCGVQPVLCCNVDNRLTSEHDSIGCF